MIQKDERTARERFVDGLSGFLQRHRIPIAVLAVAIVVGIAAFAIFAEVSGRQAEQALVQLEAVQERLDGRQGLSAEEQSQLDEELLLELNEITSSYPRTYAAQRSWFIIGIIHMDNERFAEAAQSFAQTADRFPDSHLALIARANEATAHEELGDFEAALNAYRRLLDARSGSNALTARALFSLGRLTETALDDAEAAREYYERVVQEFPQSNWTSLARNRLLALATVAP